MENGLAVNISVRIRPLIRAESVEVVKFVHGEGEEKPIIVVQDRRNVFSFDHIFSSNTHQCEVYNNILKPLVRRVIDGYNCTILAYGQTGTGKTFTMGSNPEDYKNNDAGLIPRVIDELLEIASKDSNTEISISFIEIYNDKVYDLLNSDKNKKGLNVAGFKLSGHINQTVTDNDEVQQLLRQGGRNRKCRKTNLNATSSRSHAVFIVSYRNNRTGITTKLHLVDLAGSESVTRTQNTGEAFHEGVSINKGLLTIGKVIRALSEKRSIIPYRESTLTTILQDSLNVKNYVSLLACISPSENDVNETLTTLRFAMDAKNIRSKPELERIITEYDRQHPGELGLSHTNIPPPSTMKKRRRVEPVYSSSRTKSKFTADSPTYGIMDSMSVSTSTILEPSNTNSSNINSTNINATNTNFLSPLIRKCTEQITSSIKEMLKENLQPVVQLSPWTQVHLLNAQSVQKEPLNGINENRTTLSRTHLNFDEINSPVTSSDINTFKVPALLPRRATKIDSTRAPRRSTRLSMKPAKSYTRTSILISTPEDLNKENAPHAQSPTKDLCNSAELQKRQTIHLQLDDKVASFKDLSNPVELPRRQSMRLQSNKKLCVTVPMIKDRKKDVKSPIIKRRKSRNFVRTTRIGIHSSPRSKHGLSILETLNSNKVKLIQTLPNVGPKTALQIQTYRMIHGKFKNFEDLQNMSTWRGNSFERFMQANQLTY